MIRFAWIGLWLACLLPGCVLTEQPDLGRPDLEVLPIVPGTEPGVSQVVQSREVLLVADNQLHYSGGEGIIMTAALVDMFVPTAARPAALNAFSDDVYRWCLEKGGDRPVLHLGDACDLSCVLEFTWFAEIMRANGAPWVMAPGNHDCTFMGTTLEFEWEDDSWVRASKGGGGPMDKAGFVALYLATMWEQLKDQPEADAFAAALGSSRDELLRDLPEPGLLSDRYPKLAERILRSAPSGAWSSERAGAFLTGISWHIDEETPWRSYIAQRISLTDPAQPGDTGFTGILLDTCQWWEQPALIPVNVAPPYQWNPGLNGELLADQLGAIRQWMDEASSSGNGIALFAHHPIREFTPKSRRALQYLWTNYDVIMLATGHTHEGYVKIHHDIAPTALEINVASITDWPMEWRDLQLSSYRRGDQRFYGVSSPRHTVLEEMVREGVDLRENWATFEEGAQRFLSYQASEDLALGYDTTVGDLMTGGQWAKVVTLGTLTWLLLGEGTLARRLYDNVVPNIHGLEREHLARRRLGINELMRIWDLFPAVGHATEEDWRQREIELRQLAEIAVARDSSEEQMNAAVWPIVRFELGRKVADPEAMRRHRIMLAVWASMYEANKERDPAVQSDGFRMIQGERIEQR